MSKLYQAFRLSVIVGFVSPFIVCHAGEAAMSNSNSAHALSTFQISPQVGVENHAAGLSGKANDGINPQAGLILGKDGNFYGKTSSAAGFLLRGAVFKLAPQFDGTFKETCVYTFSTAPLCLESAGRADPRERRRVLWHDLQRRGGGGRTSERCSS
ncbi:hypothetical protein EO087_00275 [Dyella sp. M7H15-1]|uniref:hypothetical protein n=1 Tax=Dyella sp. M7H15-1 TaxID=2501295 RepID=UPI001004F14F|nr:hypothetical protein [Dyella sp. M7H15-1]QAU22601.1 hypothetical protein EO087_00275 [Dyella sp. M7H15-1]